MSGPAEPHYQHMKSVGEGHMKIAFAGDWHGNLQWAREAIQYAAREGAETILHLGDYGYDFLHSYREGVESALRRAKLTLQFVDGNHENFTWLHQRPIGEDGRRQITRRVHHLPRGFRWEWDGLRFLALGGAFSVDRENRELNKSWWAEETITDKDIAEATAGGPADVLVSHDCPGGSYIPGLQRTAHYFSQSALLQANDHRHRLRKVVDVVQPRLFFHGHYHIPYMLLADYGYGEVRIRGLDCDQTTLHTNVVVLDTAELRQEVQDLRGSTT